MSFSKAQRQAVLERAGECCEYCGLALRSGIVPFHIDHIIPVKHGGMDYSDNLAFACFICNSHKSHELTGFDPKTDLITVLFHPRKQKWSEHFEIQADMQIIGITAEGRTTAHVLQMNDKERIETRQILAEVGEYPCINED